MTTGFGSCIGHQGDAEHGRRSLPSERVRILPSPAEPTIPPLLKFGVPLGLLVVGVLVHFLAKAYDRARVRWAQRRDRASAAWVGGLAICLIAAGLGVAFLVAGLLMVVSMPMGF